MEILSSAGLCLTVCVISQLLKENGEIRTALVLLCVSILFIRLTGSISQIKELIEDITEKTDLDENYLKILFKGLGICYITQIASDCCKDSGNTALATQSEIAGKTAVLVLALPLFKAVLGIIEDLVIR